MSKINVLIWHWGRRGGGPRYTLELVKALNQIPEFSLYLSLSRQSELFDEFQDLKLPQFSINTYHNKRSATLALLRLPHLRQKFKAYLRKNHIHVVLCTMNHLWNIAIAPVINQVGAKYILVVHDAQPHPGENYLVRKYLLSQELFFADEFIALTEHVKSQLQKIPKARGKFIRIAPHGTFTYGEQRNFPRHISMGRNIKILFFGRILPYKGLHLLLEAFSRLRNTRNDLELHIIGAGNIEPYQDQIKNLSCVKLVNRWISECEIADCFADKDIVVLPYIEASQSGVISIALFHGIPIVVTPVGGIQEQIKSFGVGLVAQQITGKAIADSLSCLLSDPILYENFSKQALKIAGTVMSWQSVANLIKASITTVFSQNTDSIR